MKNKISMNKPKPKDILTVIEFSSNSIKLAQSYSNKQKFITKFALQENIGDSELEFTKKLEKIIKENHLKINNLVVSLDRSLVTIRSIKLPSTSEEEIKSMAEWQAAKLLPYKVDEIVSSYQTINIDKGGFSQIILVIVPRNIIRKFTNVCDALKLRPQNITLSSEGLLRWYVDYQSHGIEDTLLLVDIRKKSSELVIIDRDKFIFSRSFSFTNIQGEGIIKKKIIEEAKLSIDSYRKQDSFQKLKKVVLTGNKEEISGLAPLFTEEFGLPVEVVNHLENIDFRKESARPDVKPHYSFASVCGLALAQKPPQIDLCPQETKDSILYLQKKRELFKTVVLGACAILVFASMLSFNFYHKKQFIEMLDEQIDKIEPTANEIQAIKNKIDIINAQLNNKNSCIEILKELHLITPADIKLNTFLFEESNNVALKGTAPTMSLVFSFVPILNKSPLFANVQVKYATQRKMKTRELTDFEIICKLSN